MKNILNLSPLLRVRIDSFLTRSEAESRAPFGYRMSYWFSAGESEAHLSEKTVLLCVGAKSLGVFQALA